MLVSYRFVYRVSITRRLKRGVYLRTWKFPRAARAPRRPSCRTNVTRWPWNFGERVIIRNSKTDTKIRRISRTMRRIDSSFRGRCYEMDPCTAPRVKESKREREKGTWVSPSYLPPPSSPYLRNDTPPPERPPSSLSLHGGYLALRPLLLLQIYKLSYFVIELSRPGKTQIR